MNDKMIYHIPSVIFNILLFYIADLKRFIQAGKFIIRQ